MGDTVDRNIPLVFYIFTYNMTNKWNDNVVNVGIYGDVMVIALYIYKQQT